MAATPTGMKGSRSQVFVGARPAPEIEGVWLVEAAIQCGLVSSTGMSHAVVTWTEIAAWAAITGWNSRWMMITIRELSMAYIVMLKEAENPATESPMEIELDEQRSTVANQFKRFVSARG